MLMTMYNSYQFCACSGVGGLHSGLLRDAGHDTRMVV